MFHPRQVAPGKVLLNFRLVSDLVRTWVPCMVIACWRIGPRHGRGQPHRKNAGWRLVLRPLGPTRVLGPSRELEEHVLWDECDESDEWRVAW